MTKIVATVGGASNTRDVLRALVLAGVDVFRLNFSHGTHEGHGEVVNLIRGIEKELDYPLGILCDLQGPKLRVGQFESGGAMLEEGAAFQLDLNPTLGNKDRVSFPHADIFSHIPKGSILLLDDGKLALEVTRNAPDVLETIVRGGGMLKDRKGVNLPGVRLPISPLTAKDLKDLEFIQTLDVDFIGLSFVQRAGDVQELRDKISSRFQIISKIEKPSALDDIDRIIALSDGIMVARGDLGIEIPIERVPLTQKKLIAAAKSQGKPVLVATQMLESMVTDITPTRAEATDVANAVYDGADGVMLSAESAVGKHPVKVVQMMQRILETTEQDPHYKDLMRVHTKAPETAEDAITEAAKQVAETVQAQFIVTCSVTGRTAQRASKTRPLRPIICVTPHITTARHLTLSWGVFPHVMDISTNVNTFLENVKNLPVLKARLKPHDSIVLTGGSPLASTGTTNFVYVEKINA